MESLSDIHPLEVGVMLKNLIFSHALGYHPHDRSHWYSQPANTENATHLARINCDPAKSHLALILAGPMPSLSGMPT